MPKPKPTFISLFSGAGGFKIGLENAGFKCLLASDIMPEAKKTHELNYKTDFLLKDVKQITSSEILNLTKGETPDVIIGGPPCQGFSVAGKMSVDDPRSQHVLNFMKIVKRLNPRSFVMENVPSLATLKNFLNF